jgi:hypothetical protein
MGNLARATFEKSAMVSNHMPALGAVAYLPDTCTACMALELQQMR